ncbi:two-component system response regulator [Candidatus Chloroploca sp. Khr17]|uniref:response regulator n=1 Tax=Candidatus Chloroploca sp. Khr17 TaxID=2496869 RepID=UPI00101C0701|nr:two-component system response regulator [Candidatus Chloroploca sp. Khr17]
MISSFVPASTRQTILIVDDAPENLTILGELLMPYYQVRVARSGIRALQVAASAPQPDLLLLDVMMPEMDGYAVLTRLRDHPATRSIPVIFVTAMDSVEDESHGLELGAVDYITKPIRPAIVLARVRTHLELKQARDWLANQNACLEAEVARRMRENQLIEDVSIRALAALAEVRDPDTGNHLRRTQIYVQVLANALATHPRFADALSQPCRDLLVKSAPLHDIGKVGIPDHILLKPGRLTPEEREIMKGHCRIGSNAIEMAMNSTLAAEEIHLLETPSHGCANKVDLAYNWPRHAPLEFLHVAREIALSHHEHWDGTGYPEGLANEAIPLSARLMALADTFDALISRRIYKPPVPMPEVVAIIREERGRQFDPDIVDTFLALSTEFQAIADHYVDSEADICAKLASIQGQPVTRFVGT